MNETELHAYALRGLTARLTELDAERARIVELLGEWDEAATAPARRKVPSVTRQREVVVPIETHESTRHDASVPAPASEPEVARVLPRRNRAQAPPPAAVAPALPPMPRLVKARAS